MGARVSIKFYVYSSHRPSITDTTVLLSSFRQEKEPHPSSFRSVRTGFFLCYPSNRNGLSISCTLTSLEEQDSESRFSGRRGGGGLRRGRRYRNLDGRRIVNPGSLDILVAEARFARSIPRPITSFPFFFLFLRSPHTILDRGFHTSVNAPPPIIRFRLLTVVVSDSFILLTTHHHMMYREIKKNA